jgi:Auxiliary Activity family 9 (formerly GH61)
MVAPLNRSGSKVCHLSQTLSFSKQSAVRKRSDSDSHEPVTDVSLLDIRCGKDASTAFAPGILTVAAGDPLGFAVDPTVQHLGPGMGYLAKVPAGKTAATWDGSGAVWFKVWEEGPISLDKNGGVWPATGMPCLPVKVCC